MTTTLNRITTAIEGTHTGLSDNQVARAIWTMIAEPGDNATGELITACGAAEALRYVVESDEATLDLIDVKTIRERTLPQISTDIIQSAFQKAERTGTILITPEHPHWPEGLNALGPHVPYALWARGNTAILTAAEGIAVVGARTATGYGEHMAMELTAWLVGQERTIISGAAYLLYRGLTSNGTVGGAKG